MSVGELRNIRKEVEVLVSSLTARRDPCAADSDTRKAIDVILKHIDDHGESLWGHEIELSTEQGGGRRLVARTNNDLEGFFRYLKHDERRRSGRKVLTQDFEHLPPEAALVVTYSMMITWRSFAEASTSYQRPSRFSTQRIAAADWLGKYSSKASSHRPMHCQRLSSSGR